tara:strand:- start:102 stop:794 length:693 start_codon:yes stop_codon:yes gene_type:complete
LEAGHNKSRNSRIKILLSPTKVLLVIVGFCLLSTQSFASIVSGNVSTGSGSFINLSGALPANVGNDNFQDDNLYAFDEAQNLVLGANLAINVLPAGGAGTISAGTSISSHYVFFDPAGSTSQIGTVLFDGPILGIITYTAELLASDSLGSMALNYLNPTLRGLEDNIDSAFVSLMNANEVTVDWRASTPGYYIRVITASAVPIPAAFWLFGSALLATVGWSKKRGVAVSA